MWEADTLYAESVESDDDKLSKESIDLKMDETSGQEVDVVCTKYNIVIFDMNWILTVWKIIKLYLNSVTQRSSTGGREIFGWFIFFFNQFFFQ